MRRVGFALLGLLAMLLAPPEAPAQPVAEAPSVTAAPAAPPARTRRVRRPVRAQPPVSDYRLGPVEQPQAVTRLAPAPVPNRDLELPPDPLRPSLHEPSFGPNVISRRPPSRGFAQEGATPREDRNAPTAGARLSVPFSY